MRLQFVQPRHFHSDVLHLHFVQEIFCFWPLRNKLCINNEQLFNRLPYICLDNVLGIQMCTLSDKRQFRWTNIRWWFAEKSYLVNKREDIGGATLFTIVTFHSSFIIICPVKHQKRYVNAFFSNLLLVFLAKRKYACI